MVSWIGQKEQFLGIILFCYSLPSISLITLQNMKTVATVFLILIFTTHFISAHLYCKCAGLPLLSLTDKTVQCCKPTIGDYNGASGECQLSASNKAEEGKFISCCNGLSKRSLLRGSHCRET